MAGLLLGPAPDDPWAVYERVADRYERFRALWIGLAGDAVEQALLAELRAIPKPGQRVLDAGCGMGALARHIVALQPDVALTMLDLSPAMLAHADGIPGQRIGGSVLDLPFPDGSFAIVVSGGGDRLDHPAAHDDCGIPAGDQRRRVCPLHLLLTPGGLGLARGQRCCTRWPQPLRKWDHPVCRHETPDRHSGAPIGIWCGVARTRTGRAVTRMCDWVHIGWCTARFGCSYRATRWGVTACRLAASAGSVSQRTTSRRSRARPGGGEASRPSATCPSWPSCGPPDLAEVLLPPHAPRLSTHGANRGDRPPGHLVAPGSADVRRRPRPHALRAMGPAGPKPIGGKANRMQVPRALVERSRDEPCYTA